MKYWVYKESRILGPFDKEAVSGLPGLDAATLVCPGDPDGGAWVPAGELADLSGLSFAEYPKTGAAAGGAYEFPSALGLLDRLQIDVAGLVGDDEFPGALAEELFQDADLKKSFGDVLPELRSFNESELRRSQDKVSELMGLRETLYRRISELEAGQTDLTRRLTEKDLELSRRGSVNDPGSGIPPPMARPEVPPIESVAPALPEIPVLPMTEPYGEEMPPPHAVGKRPTERYGEAALPTDPGSGTPSPMARLEVPPPNPLESGPPPPAVGERPPTPDKTLSFDKPKSFKVVPTVQSFKVVPAPELSVAAPEIVPTPIPEPAPIAAATPAVLTPERYREEVPPPHAVGERPPALLPFPTQAPEFVVLDPLSIRASVPTPAPPPPNTLSTDVPVTDLAVNDRPDAGGVTPPAPDAALARFAKPALTTDAPKKSVRTNKSFLIVGVVVVLLLLVVGLILMRQPKDDLKQMTNLDDGKAPIGVLNLDEENALAPGPAKPRAVAPEPLGLASVSHEAEIAMVKDFPLDGGRGTVGRWLQYSYTAGPDAGTEEWNASTTADKTVLVEYRLVPGPKGGNAALYLFELDAERGLVMGKNLEARRMLAGGPLPETPKAKKTPAAKKSKRAAKRAVPAPKEVPLLPLPDSGELRPPSEDDGAFDSDTINSGI